MRFVRQPLQPGLGHAVLCTKRVVGEDPFVVLLADDFIPLEYNLVYHMVNSFKKREKTQLLSERSMAQISLNMGL